MTESIHLGRPTGVHFQLFSRGTDQPVRWRFLSANNREMARGSIEYDTPEICRDGIDDFKATAHNLDPIVRRTPDHQWQWELFSDTSLVVVCGHVFDRQIRCAQALEQFLASVPTAHVAAALMVSDYRRWHSASPVGGTGLLGIQRRGSSR
jgi:hypothetical protein